MPRRPSGGSARRPRPHAASGHVLGQQAQQLPPAPSPGGCSVVWWGRAIATRVAGSGAAGLPGKGVAGAVKRSGQQEGTGQEGEGPEHNDLRWGLHRRRAEALREGEAGCNGVLRATNSSLSVPALCTGSGQGPQHSQKNRQ